MNLKEQVLERVHAEQKQLRKELTQLTTGEFVYNRAYEICYKNEIVCTLESTLFSDEVYKELLEQPNILHDIYTEWLRDDSSVCEMIENVIWGVVE